MRVVQTSHGWTIEGAPGAVLYRTRQSATNALRRLEPVPLERWRARVWSVPAAALELEARGLRAALRQVRAVYQLRPDLCRPGCVWRVYRVDAEGVEHRVAWRDGGSVRGWHREDDHG